MIELERSFLPRSLPAGLAQCEHVEVRDLYFPKSAEHPKLRVRKMDGKMEVTKKGPTRGRDSSEMLEQTIPLTNEEYGALTKSEGKELVKTRYFYEHEGKVLEFGVFHGGLEGLVIIDVEFSSAGEKDSFRMPDFCLADVTQEKFAAGGMLCGKTYAQVETRLQKFRYRKLFLG